MSQSPIELKGSSFTLSVVHLNDPQPEAIRQALQEKVRQAPAFLKNAPVVINVAALDADIDWLAIRQAVTDAGLRVVGVSGCQNEEQKNAVLLTGMPMLSEGRTPRNNSVASILTHAPAKTRIINTPVRSGQQIYARNGDLIVISHVSAGAELIADGNIHVYGMMRGRALAGASGDTSSQIFCTHLGAELVSIAGQYWLSDRIPSDFNGQAARLSLQDNVLTIQPLN
jgi:septum site-determining protein MinC